MKNARSKTVVSPDDFYADIHVHATTVPFLVKELSSPWDNYDITKSEAERRKRSMKLTRSDFTKLMNANVRLISLSFTLLERYVPSKVISSPMLLSTLMGLDLTMIRRILTTQPFKVFQEEFAMFQANLKDKNSDRVAEVAHNYDHLQRILKDPNKLAVVLSMEGAHNLGFEYSDDNFPVEHKKANMNRIEPAEILNEDLVDERVKFLKDNHFFIFTINHFVYNNLASMPKAWELTGLKKVLHNPFVTMKKMGELRGLTYLGYYMVERLFENNIILDVKHCDAVTRRQIYRLAKKFGKTVVASHVACSGRITNFANHKLIQTEDEVKHRHLAETFNPWDINMHDDDIVAIHELKGLFGLILDERVLGSSGAILRANGANNSVQLVFNQIERVYLTLKTAGFPPAECFDILCMGADHDGVIDPINAVPTVEDYRFDPQTDSDDTQKLDRELVKLFRKHYSTFAESELEPEQIVQKIMRENTMRFLSQHFR